MACRVIEFGSTLESDYDYPYLPHRLHLVYAYISLIEIGVTQYTSESS